MIREQKKNELSEKDLILEHWRLWSIDRNIPDYEFWKKKYLKHDIDDRQKEITSEVISKATQWIPEKKEKTDA